MKIELHVNGFHQVIMIPETKVEFALLCDIAEQATKGSAVKLARSKSPEEGAFDRVTLSVEV